MPLSWNEIRDRAVQFSREWEDVSSEDAEAKSFLDAFFNVFGISRRRIASFEERVTKLDGKTGYIDLLWKGKLLVEHKSRGKNLDLAYKQATDYFPGLKEAELPRYILVCDFENFRLKDLEADETVEFKLEDFPASIKHFGFIAGYETHTYKEQDPVNIQAAERMGKLHDELRDIGYTGHELEVLLVRLLFCLFAEDTGIFLPTGIFEEYIRARTSEDGSDLASKLNELFDILNQKENERLRNLDEDLARFPYVNGKLFSERLRTAAFTSKMRKQLLDCCELNWSTISPAIFGALFQSIMDKTARRNLGAHYTSEKNILKLIKPLFLDALWEEFNKIKRNPPKLAEFQKRLRSLTFLDPACGCGNFLVIAYRELRLLELEVIRSLLKSPSFSRRGQGVVDPGEGIQLGLNVHDLIMLDVDQFYGIELEEFPAQIAQVALWLVDHQMNTKIGEEFGQYFARIPLTTSATIVNGNALRINWESVVPKEKLSYILGNPPFSGAMVMGPVQREDMKLVFSDLKGFGVLDYVSCWYWKSAKFVKGTTIKVGLVSTNSITQGEQVGILWSQLVNKFGVTIHFAHRTFRWSNEASGMAAVHCIIIGFANYDSDAHTIFEYSSPEADPHAVDVKQINPYLVNAPNVFLLNRDKPIAEVPGMRFGSMPRDGGHLVLSPEEKARILKREPQLKPYILEYVGSEEFLNAGERYCYWLVKANPSTVSASQELRTSLEAVRKFRSESVAASTRKFAATPGLFCQIAQPSKQYLLVPGVSSERRPYIPVGFMEPNVIASNLVFVVPDATPYHFGVLSSAMHMAWVRYTCGRLESRYRYSKDIVYNNFPWPESPTSKQKIAVMQAAQNVLITRSKYPSSSLADLYDPLTMPGDLLKAHQKLDKAVDAAYGKRTFATEAERVAYLFELYQKLTEPLMAGEEKKKKVLKSKAA